MGTFASFAQTPQLPQPQQQQQKVEVSDGELQKFANAFQGIRMVNQQAQQEMMSVVEEGGMDVQKFNEIHQASMDPAVEVEASKEDLQKHQAIASELEEMQGTFQAKMEKVITDADLTLQRYEQIAMGLQSDPELQERLKAVFEG
ncbi:hypothetical protein GCM10007103_03810 [Salinimicrobium marinum]|uniref:DUF4168 domain-containing protein n=2 Tax=Salinimicrobium marinum TaxID=680283 RepID=A0A918S7N7_9FLAO|nr:hypothetical protein GCM10007103_03810 [Salinimicrobium marinum]